MEKITKKLAMELLDAQEIVCNMRENLNSISSTELKKRIINRWEQMGFIKLTELEKARQFIKSLNIRKVDNTLSSGYVVVSGPQGNIKFFEYHDKEQIDIIFELYEKHIKQSKIRFKKFNETV